MLRQDYWEPERNYFVSDLVVRVLRVVRAKYKFSRGCRTFRDAVVGGRGHNISADPRDEGANPTLGVGRLSSASQGEVAVPVGGDAIRLGCTTTSPAFAIRARPGRPRRPAKLLAGSPKLWHALLRGRSMNSSRVAFCRSSITLAG